MKNTSKRENSNSIVCSKARNLFLEALELVPVEEREKQLELFKRDLFFIFNLESGVKENVANVSV